jgi:hypothetical protein
LSRHSEGENHRRLAHAQPATDIAIIVISTTGGTSSNTWKKATGAAIVSGRRICIRDWGYAVANVTRRHH